MGQNAQFNKEYSQIKENINRKKFFNTSQKGTDKKILLLILIVVIVIIIATISYFLFFYNKANKNKLLPNNDNLVSDNNLKKERKNNKKLDSDRDELPDYIEKILGTNENNSDTDGDTYSDFKEIKNGYNPLKPSPGDKFSIEELERIKDEIKNADSDYYEEVFGKNNLAKTGESVSALESFNEMKKAIESKDFEAYKKVHLSKDISAIEELLSKGWDFTLPSSISFVKEEKKNSNIVITAIEIDKDGNKKEVKYVFVKEDGKWKVDLKATIEANFEKDDEIKDTDGFVDLQVLDIVVSPDPPIAGDKGIVIEARIKNIGTASVTEAVDYKGIIANSEYPGVGSFAGVIKPNEIVRMEIPYSAYLFFTNDEEPGKKDVYFEVNYNKEIKESNYDNNSIKRTVTFIQ